MTIEITERGGALEIRDDLMKLHDSADALFEYARAKFIAQENGDALVRDRPPPVRPPVPPPITVPARTDGPLPVAPPRPEQEWDDTLVFDPEDRVETPSGNPEWDGSLW
jgi:hypothetical protein